MNYKPYAGIGSRDTPVDVMKTMTGVAVALAGAGFTLRSGFANGADMAFEEGCDHINGKKEIFIPWFKFNGSNGRPSHIVASDEQFSQAMRLSAQFHPNWDNLSQPVKKLMARNAFQVLGLNLLSPVQFIICWTPGGQMKGGTSQALRIAQAHNIKIVNLGSETGMEDLQELGRLL
jgi:hypothetical protein